MDGVAMMAGVAMSRVLRVIQPFSDSLFMRSSPHFDLTGGIIAGWTGADYRATRNANSAWACCALSLIEASLDA